jgi:putative endonuclease
MQQEKSTTTEIGRKAESIAATWLETQGYSIVDRNYTYRKVGELDIIAQHESTVVFVEVRFRTRADYGLPEQSLTPTKISRIRRTAEAWLVVHHRYGTACRFDVIAVDFVNGKQHVRHFPNAF